MHTRWIIILTLALSSIVIIPLFLSGFILTHDMYFPLFRLYGIEQCFQEGQIPPRWVSSFALGYGYPFYNFYAPLAYYVAYLFHLLGMGYATSIHATFIFGFLFGGIGAYYWTNDIFKNKLAGLVSAIVYVYFPYHLVQVYVRGDISEFFATAFFPWVLFFFYKIIQEKSKLSLWYLIGASITYAAVILSHNIMAIIFTAFLLVYLVYLIIMQKSSYRDTTGVWLYAPTLYCLLGLLLGLGLSAYFWLPALVEKQFVSIDYLTNAADYRNHFVSILDLINPQWGFGGSESGAANRMSLQLGLAPILLSLTSLFLVFYKPKGNFSQFARNWYRFSWIVLLILVFLMLPISKPIWQILPMARFILYPWRLLALAALPLALLSGYLIYLVGAGSPRPFQQVETKVWGGDTLPLLYTIIALILTIALSAIYLKHRSIPIPNNAITNEFIWNCESAQKTYGTTMSNEYLPQSVSRMPNEFATEPITTIAGEVTFHPQFISGVHREWEINAIQPSVIRLNTFYFPGWQVALDGKHYEVQTDSAGRMLLAVPKGRHQIKEVFGNTPIRKIGDYISILTFLLLLIYFLYHILSKTDAGSVSLFPYIL